MRCLLPKLQRFYEREEGQRILKEWKDSKVIQNKYFPSAIASDGHTKIAFSRKGGMYIEHLWVCAGIVHRSK